MTVWGMQRVATTTRDKQLETASMPALAARYLSELQRRQAHGPYYLLGYSYGGPVVYEMAQQLIRDGERVGFLGLIDAPVGGHSQCTAGFDRASSSCAGEKAVQALA